MIAQPDKKDDSSKVKEDSKSTGKDTNKSKTDKSGETSKDGTKVPMNIIRRKGTKLDHNNPTLLYGYGGYGANTMPAHQRGMR